MKQSGAVGRLVTLRLLAQRFAFAFLVVAAIGLMVMGKADITPVERTRSFVSDFISPVLDVLSRPTAAVARVADNFHDIINLRAENARLTQENARLLHWQTVARKLEAENAILAQQLNVVPDPDPSFVTARVIGDLGGPFGQSMLLNAGSSHGVRKGQAVLSGEALVGHISEVAEDSSRLLLISDINARIPVTLETSRARAILAGDNKERPRLNYLPGAANASVGERVVTSASGGAFPPGIPVGVVVASNDGIARVMPFAQRHDLEFVSVVDFGLGGIVPFEKPPETRRGRR